MILGIGIDTVTISNVERFLQNPAYADDIFTETENTKAEEFGDVIDYLSARFAGKQAVRKCLAPFLKGFDFDFRMIEILKQEDGTQPVTILSEELAAIIREAGIRQILVSTTTEGDNATAIAIAQ